MGTALLGGNYPFRGEPCRLYTKLETEQLRLLNAFPRPIQLVENLDGIHYRLSWPALCLALPATSLLKGIYIYLFFFTCRQKTQ